MAGNLSNNSSTLTKIDLLFAQLCSLFEGYFQQIISLLEEIRNEDDNE